MCRQTSESSSPRLEFDFPEQGNVASSSRESSTTPGPAPGCFYAKCSGRELAARSGAGQTAPTAPSGRRIQVGEGLRVLLDPDACGLFLRYLGTSFSCQVSLQLADSQHLLGKL